MYFIPSFGASTGKTVYASIAGLVMILGYVAVPTIVNALVRQYIPKGEEGSFMGIRMLFVVALPMCIGPFIGNGFNQAYGESYEGDYSVVGKTPSKFGYLMALAVLVLALIPTYFYLKEQKKGTKNENLITK
jgi:MFS family permease